MECDGARQIPFGEWGARRRSSRFLWRRRFCLRRRGAARARLSLAAKQVFAQRRGAALLPFGSFVLARPRRAGWCLAHAHHEKRHELGASSGACQPRRGCAMVRQHRRRGSSGAEHTLGKGGVGGSIPLRGTIVYARGLSRKNLPAGTAAAAVRSAIARKAAFIAKAFPA